jgi:hypothetical protein
MTTDELRALFEAAIDAASAADVARARSDAAAVAYNLALAEERARRRVPPGYSIDVLGDGEIRPLAECVQKGQCSEP